MKRTLILMLMILVVGCNDTTEPEPLDFVFLDDTASGTEITDTIVSAVKECELITKYHNETISHYRNRTACYHTSILEDCENKDSILNKTDGKCYLIKDWCYTYQTVDWIETIQKNEQVCKENTKVITFKDDVLEYEKEHKGCTVHEENIICDHDNTGDGNGDGICDSGETCYYYDLNNDIELIAVYNGATKIK